MLGTFRRHTRSGGHGHVPRGKKWRYLTWVIQNNPWEFFRLAQVGWATFKHRFLLRCAGPGTIIEPDVRIVNAANVHLGRNCLLKEGVYLRAGVEGRIEIGDEVAINAFARIFGHGGVWIGARSQIGPDVLITTTGHDYNEDLRTEYRPVHIGQQVWIGAKAVILPGVTIGDGAVIGAGSIVTKDIRPGMVAVGVPARTVWDVQK